MRVVKYVVIHLKAYNPVGVFPASTKREARKIQRDLMDVQNFGAREVEEVWIWNIETNEQDP